MKLQTIKIADASDRQLLDYLRTFLQVETSHQANRLTLITKIEKAQPGNESITIVAAGEPEPVHGAPPARVEGAAGAAPVADTAMRLDTSSSDDPRVRLIIHEQSGLGNYGKRPVPVGVNGRTMLIPRQREVSIPYRYFEALKNAMETQYEDVTDEDNATKVERIETNAHSYPFSVIESPSKAEVAAWYKRREDEQAGQVVARQNAAAKATAATIGALAAAAGAYT